MRVKQPYHAWDVGLVAFVTAVVALLVVPVPPWAMDALVAGNVAMALLVLVAALFADNPVGFSAFPSVLLFTTLFRLALNVSSTRLILSQADPGRIISGFGSAVVRDDLVVGIVVFSVVMLVLFLVITKGAERVAEVAARFTLDALPGMQAAIELDCRTGAISPAELRSRRERLEAQSLFYGSLDGAMKFVRGDAVVTLAIAGVNFAGGLFQGVWRHHMGWADALDVYGRLTVGDGLVTMVPAMLVSSAAGILVTRVAQPGSEVRLGGHLAAQLAGSPMALTSAAAVLVALSVLPGLPAWPFLVAAVAAGSGAAWRWRTAPAATHHRDTAVDAVGVDAAQARLDAVARTAPVLVREVQKAIPLPRLAALLSEFERDGIAKAHTRRILEALVHCPDGDLDTTLIAVRNRLGSALFSMAGFSPPVQALVFSPEWEQYLLERCHQGVEGRRLVLSDEDAQEVRQCVTAHPKVRVVLADPVLRRPLARWLASRGLALSVFSHSEVDRENVVQPVPCH